MPYYFKCHKVFCIWYSIES